MPTLSPAAKGWRPGIRRRPQRLALRRLRSIIGDQRGAAVAFIALSLPLLMVAAGLVVDVAFLFWLRTSLQAAADMAALAGAQAVNLELLAEGERRLIAEQATADARYWLRANLESHPATSQLTDKINVTVDVYNAAPDDPLLHRWTGRLLTDPTVSVRLTVPAPTFFVRALIREVPLTIAADASLLEKAAPLPYDDVSR